VFAATEMKRNDTVMLIILQSERLKHIANNPMSVTNDNDNDRWLF